MMMCLRDMNQTQISSVKDTYFSLFLDFFGYLDKGISFNKMVFIFLWVLENGKKKNMITNNCFVYFEI